MLTKYKAPLRKLKISHREVSDYIGHSREMVTNWLNGVLTPPAKVEAHIAQEIDEMIYAKKEAIKMGTKLKYGFFINLIQSIK